MGIDSIKVIFTYALATILVLGGLWIIYATRLDPPEADVQGLRLLMATMIGGATQYVFNRETANNSARQTERAIKITPPTNGSPPA